MQQDSDFFLLLLPGARDRSGLPESIRFWKAHLEATDPEEAFPVGLLCGPSGCGKSSLVKAGIVPRLAPRTVPIYLEATPATTEARLLAELQKRCPALAGLGLVEACAALRRGEGGLPGRKVVVFLDQFEQWLHAHPGLKRTVLARALRQCDGAHLQCVLMVRDDFWMSVTRFLDEVEVPLVEGTNCAAVELFSPRHARKVLAAFGAAYGALPHSHEDALDQSQRDFLRAAVDGITEGGAVIPVRLALLADMLRSRAWTIGSLAQLGGASGIGAAFLEETFSAANAPPEHRYHQRAARNVQLAEHRYLATKSFPKEERFGMTSQIRRAAASIPANMAEGQGREHTKEFLNHLSIARGSLMELETHLMLSQRVGLLEAAELEKLLGSSDRISRMLSGLRKALQRKQDT